MRSPCPSWFAISVVVVLVSLRSTLVAAESAFVEVDPPKNTEPWVGQRVDFAVNLVVLGRFSGATVFDLPPVSGAILLKPEDRAVVSSRTIDDQEYSTQRHSFSLFCQTEKKVVLPEFTVRCGSSDRLGGGEQRHVLRVPSLEVMPRMPPGARSGEVIVTTMKMEVKETWNPVPDKAQIGDAFQRTIHLKANDVPGMLLPSLPTPTLPHLATYPQEPAVHDQMQRGAFTGRREERMTYMVESAGVVEIPEFRLRWWNPSTSSWEEQTLPSIDLEIMAASVPATGLEEEDVSDRWWWLALLLVLAGGFGLLLRRRRVEEDELSCFRAVLRACEEGNVGAAYKAVTHWRAMANIEIVAPPAEVQEELMRLQQAMIAPGVDWQGRALATCLKYWRRQVRRARGRKAREAVLPTLNP